MTTESNKPIGLPSKSWLVGGEADPIGNSRHGLMGQRISRLDGPLKVQGAARFAAEFNKADMLYASLLYSTIASGRIATLDVNAAEAAPGVKLVMTYRNAPRLQTMPAFGTAPKAAAGDDLPVMQDDRIHWNGQPVALVLAQTQEQADHARTLIKITYASDHAITSFAEAKKRGATPAKFFGQPLQDEVGDAEAAFAAAPHKVDATYITPRHNHNAIEPHAVTVLWTGDTLSVHDASQNVSHTAWSLAHAFGIDEKQVHVTSPFVGGGFGGKTLWQHHVLAAAAARLSGAPVRLSLSREGVYRGVGGRTNTEQRVAIGADKDGRFKALIQTGTVSMTTHNNMPEPFILPARTLYASDTLKLGVETVAMNMLANTFMRAPGESVGSFALESAIDELAEELGIDPIELRQRNQPDKAPVGGQPFSNRNFEQIFRDGAERFGWKKRGRARTQRDGDWHVGMGVATATYPYHRMPGGAARITLDARGHALVEVAAHDMGMGTGTAQTQITADRLGLAMGQVEVRYGDSTFPGIILAGGSQQSASIGAGIGMCQRNLFEKLLKLAGNDSPLAGLSVDEVSGHNGGLCKRDEPGQWESYERILARAGVDTVVAEGEAPPPEETMRWSIHSYGAMFCEARVHAVTGELRISRLLGSFDCGRILNPKMAESQFRGGMIMGMGLAMMEETQFDERNGRIMNASLAEYHIPAHMDVPKIDVIWTDIPDPHTPMGARGIGEIGITGVAAAIANAVFNATGKRIRDLPITLDKLL